MGKEKGSNRTKAYTGESWVHAKFPGLQVVDAVKSIQWHVERTDNEAAQRKDPQHCGLANAIAREEGIPNEHIVVMRTRAYVVYPSTKGTQGVAVRYALPERTRQAVINNDRYGHVDEGPYTLSAPAPANRLGAMRTRGNTRGPHLKTRAAHLGIKVGRVPGVRNAIQM